MIGRRHLLGLIACFFLVTPGALGAQENVQVECAVTPYAEEGLAHNFTTTWFGSGDFWAGPAPSYRGIWYAGSEGMKVQWRRPYGAVVTAEGKRLDVPAPPLQVTITQGYDQFPYQFSRLLFPTEGCWEVTGRIEDRELRFVVWVHPEADDPQITPPPTPVANLWETLHRPLAFPTLEPGASCPISTVQQTSRVEGAVLGDGPLYVQGLGDDGRTRMGGMAKSGDAYAIPVRWIATPEATGSFLIRGLRLDTAEPIVFGGPEPSPELQIWDITSQGSPDWQVWSYPGSDNLRLPGPGCYGLQIDGEHFTEVIVFAATDEIAPEDTSPQP